MNQISEEVDSTFEREKWRADLRLREEEIAIKAREQASRERETEIKANEQRRSRWSSPLVLAILAATVAAVGNAGVSWINSAGQQKLETDRTNATKDLEESKSQATLILEVIKTNNPDTAAENLKLLVNAGLVTGPKSKNIKKYLSNRKPGEGAFLPTSLAATFNPEVFRRAISLKVETLAMLNRAGEAFSVHKKDVDSLTIKIDDAAELAASIPNNQLSAAQWQILRNPEGALYGGFVRLWVAQGTLSAAYRTAKKEQLARAFDLIICLEANKKEPVQCAAANADKP